MRVSVLLPVRNGGSTLEEALRSLAAQTLKDWECTVVDDGSTDETWERLRTWAARDRRFRPVRTPARGIVAALNTALKISSRCSPYIARMDADDHCDPDRFARQVTFLDTHAAIGLVSCRVCFGGDTALSQGFSRYVDWLNSLCTPEDIALARFRESPLAHPSVMFRRSVMEAHGGYAEGPFPEDYELWLRWLDAGVRMAKVPDTLLVWNDSPHRLTRTHDRYAEDGFTRVRVRYLARWLRRRFSEQSGAVPVWIWGAGRISRRRATPLEAHGVDIRAWIDIDPKKIGNRVAGRWVIGPQSLPRPGEGFILVFLSARGAAEQAAAWLMAKGYVQGKHFLLCS